MKAILLPFLLAAFLGPGLVAAAPTNLVLISVDTLRADTLHCYGFPHPLSPAIDGLAEQGVLFEDVITTIGKTGPAFGSLFTSLYPPTHGARRNGVRIRDDVPLLAEMLQGRGFRTAAFVSNWTLKPHLSGLDRGFDVWDDRFNKVRYGLGPAERDAVSVTEDSLFWLDTFVEAYPPAERPPLFLWAHYSDPHSPYELHRDHVVPESASDATPRSRKYWRYASEVAYTDHWIGRLLEGLAERLDLDRTLIVFVADHGESFGEHGYTGHGRNTHWPNLRIPLILVGPELPEGLRISHPTTIVDVLPTVLELLEIPSPDGLEGKSLVNSWTWTSSAERARFAFGDRSTATDRVSRTEYDDPIEISVQTPGVKTIYHFGKKSVRYYDLLADPLEKSPQASPPQSTEPPLRLLLASWYRDLAKFSQAEGELSDEDVEQLKALGYITD